jgi:hypothetical protein
LLPGHPVFALVWLVSSHALLAIYFAFKEE